MAQEDVKVSLLDRESHSVTLVCGTRCGLHVPTV